MRSRGKKIDEWEFLFDRQRRRVHVYRSLSAIASGQMLLMDQSELQTTETK